MQNLLNSVENLRVAQHLLQQLCTTSCGMLLSVAIVTSCCKIVQNVVNRKMATQIRMAATREIEITRTNVDWLVFTFQGNNSCKFSHCCSEAAFIRARFPASRPKQGLQRNKSLLKPLKDYQKNSFRVILSSKLYPLAGLYSVNQSNLIFAPRGKTAVAVLAAVNGNESTIIFTAQ